MTRRGRSGQALVEFALVFPIFVIVLFSIITYGLYVFYGQQLENATREAARYAAIHSSTAQCPTVSRLDPPTTLQPTTYYRCDAPEDGWPLMTGAGRSKIWAIAPAQVSFTACWSGYVDQNGNYDALPDSPNVFTDCTMRSPGGGTAINPQTNSAALPCPAGTTGSATSPATADGDDKGSDTAVVTSTTAASPSPSVSTTTYPTTVTVYGCFTWSPPMAGFVVIPSTITMRSVITEVLQRQQ